MIASQFNLDHRLNELRPTTDEIRLARVRDAAAPATRAARTLGDVVRDLIGAAPASSRPTRMAA